MDWHRFLEQVMLVVGRTITDVELTYVKRCYNLGLSKHDTAYLISGQT
jgi:hypothetical protein